MTKYYAHTLKIHAQKNERSHKYIIFKTYNKHGTSNRICFHSRGDTYSRDSINNIMFSLHLTVNTCCDMGIKSFLTIPDIEQKRLCGKLNSHFT